MGLAGCSDNYANVYALDNWLSPKRIDGRIGGSVDAAAVKHWEEYSAARNEMLARTHTTVAPWTIVKSDDKPLARINVIRDLLTRLEFKGKDRQADLPDPDIVFNFHADAISNGMLAK